MTAIGTATGRPPARDRSGRAGALGALVRGFADAPVPDGLRRRVIAALVEAARRGLPPAAPDLEADFARVMADRPIAEHADLVNRQHYELPAAFFRTVLGPALKYSSGYFATGRESLAEGEQAALDATCEHAALADGMRILELGCGWGSLTLHMARRYPAARIVAVSNSAPQAVEIRRRAAEAGLSNVEVVTCDASVFAPEGRFQRIVSVEMFEHVANWRALLSRARGWLEPDGRLFLHVFSHRAAPYRFEVDDPDDWIAQHFFAGGLMPSHGLIRAYGDLFEVEADWRWSGAHYARTARLWLENLDARRAEAAEILRPVYGAETPLWVRRWRLFFLSVEGLFGARGGEEWGVSHWRLRPRADA